MSNTGIHIKQNRDIIPITMCSAIVLLAAATDSRSTRFYVTDNEGATPCKWLTCSKILRCSETTRCWSNIWIKCNQRAGICVFFFETETRDRVSCRYTVVPLHPKWLTSGQNYANNEETEMLQKDTVHHSAYKSYVLLTFACFLFSAMQICSC